MYDIELYFNKHFCELDRKAIYSLNEQDNGPINNVIANLNEYCYGLCIYDDKEFIEYLIYYIDNRNGLIGYGLLLTFELDESTRFHFTMEFCKILNDIFPNVDIIDAFNTIQITARSVFEKMGFFTVGNEVHKISRGKDAIGILLNKKGILRFPTMNKVSLYRWFFNEDENNVNVDNSKNKKIYLILDSSNNLIKIGQSFNPNLREKTLQGISPKWDLITTWIAPISEEKYLHELFKSKRIRGEWFNLNFSDLKLIKEYMKKYIK